MKRILAVALAAAFIGTSGTAFAQQVGTVYTEASDGYVGDEPNVGAPSTLPFCAPRDRTVDPSCDYPADSNGFGADLSSTGAPGKVLAASWRSDLCVNRAGNVGAIHQPCYANTPQLLTRLAGQNWMLPGLGQWWAWYGTWHDLNDDGWITDHARSERIGVSTRGDCTTTPSTTDSNGVGTGQPTGSTGVSARCIDAGDEWKGDQTATIVYYVTPGDYGQFADFVNFNFNNDTSAPDGFMQGRASPETTDDASGRYYSPGSNFDYVIVDNSILETSVSEVISNPVTGTGGDRTHEAGASSFVDVDVYTSVSPALETLYAGTVIAALTAQGCDVEFTVLMNACPTLQQRTTRTITEVVRASPAQPVIDDANDAIAGLAQPDVMTGPADDIVFPAWEREQLAQDYSSPHLYMDQRLTDDQSISGVATHLGDPAFNQMPATPDDNQRRPKGHVDVQAVFGVWHDKNGDGVIGAWAEDNTQAGGLVDTTDDGCPDKYDCGNIDDPNDYNPLTADGEWVAACGSKATDAPNPAGSYYATLSSSTGSWGTGVYVMTDRRVAQNPAADTMIQDGRSPFNPYDDMVLDVADDGDVDALRTSGDIVVHMFCTAGGAYSSYERLLFLDGTNRGFDVITTGTITGDFSTNGVPAGESVSDEDRYAAFSI